MDYHFQNIEKKWREEWRKRSTYRVTEDLSKEKFYVLDMFPYPSGAGLHVGHPLGYIASDIYARFMRHRGYNVLHPMGYDSFGLPAEQYAIQTGQHPAITTEQNIARYREQLDKIGFSFDWSREVRTSDPSYYKWTQWIFKQVYNSWYNNETDKAEPISTLVEKFESNGTYNVNASCDEKWYEELDRSQFWFGENWTGEFSATDWKSMNAVQKEQVLMQFRLAYLADSVVNWCPALGTVLANDEVKDGVSERGGHPVEQKLMRQWSMRITAYAQRLLDGLEKIDWSESIKEVQRNWIGRSEGASVHFAIDGHPHKIEVFTTRPDTIFGVSFMTLAPEHDLVDIITAAEYKDAVNKYVAAAKLKTERDRQSEVKNITGQFTGAYALHPFTGEKIPVWIGDYVLAGYGTGAVMAVPAGDQRDWDFAKKFDLPIPQIFENVDISEKAEVSKEAVLCNSQFLDHLSYKDATPVIIRKIEEKQIGRGKVNYRMRDAVFSRQRYWGEPFPVYYDNELPYLIDDKDLPVVLPPVDKFLPTETGEPPLARAVDWVPRSPLSKGEGRHDDGSDSPSDGVRRGAGGYHLPEDNDTILFEPDQEKTWYHWQTANIEIWNRLLAYARDMRKNPTDEENILWQEVRNSKLGHKIRRQHAIKEFIADFVCIPKRLVIEIDGGYHNSKEQKEYDEIRTLSLGLLGFKVIRFSNNEVNDNLAHVLKLIKEELDARETFIKSQPGSSAISNAGVDAMASKPLTQPLSKGEGSELDNSPLSPAEGSSRNDNPISRGEGRSALRSDTPSDEVRPGAGGNLRYEYNTMPGWAGSSWYFLRYMDPHNEKEFVSKEKAAYWGQVDFYVGGAEHGTGHLLYSRFWTKILFDLGCIPFDEPFKKMINQGMIQGRSSFVYRDKKSQEFISSDKINGRDVQSLHVEISLVDNDVLNIEAFKKWREEYANAKFVLNEDGKYICGTEIEKMSKSKYNVQTPDELVEKFGADTLRCYEMFLGPVEQSKPWDTKGINGVHNFLRKLWRLFHDQENVLMVSDAAPTPGELKTLHKTIKKITEDLQRHSWNTCVSAFMICVNELQEQKCNKKAILEPLCVLISPFAPHIAEELWEQLGHTESVTAAVWPVLNTAFLEEDAFEYPVSFNGKTRFFISLPVDMAVPEIEKAVLTHESASKFLEGKTPKKIIVVPKRIVNVVI